MGNGGRRAVGGHHVMLQELKEEGQGVQVVDKDVLGVVGLEQNSKALCKREERNHVHPISSR